MRKSTRRWFDRGIQNLTSNCSQKSRVTDNRRKQPLSPVGAIARGAPFHETWTWEFQPTRGRTVGLPEVIRKDVLSAHVFRSGMCLVFRLLQRALEGGFWYA